MCKGHIRTTSIDCVPRPVACGSNLSMPLPPVFTTVPPLLSLFLSLPDYPHSCPSPVIITRVHPRLSSVLSSRALASTQCRRTEMAVNCHCNIILRTRFNISSHSRRPRYLLTGPQSEYFMSVVNRQSLRDRISAVDRACKACRSPPLFPSHLIPIPSSRFSYNAPTV